MLRLPARGPDQMRGVQGGMHARTCAQTSTNTHIHQLYRHALSVENNCGMLCHWMLQCINGRYQFHMLYLYQLMLNLVSHKWNKNTPTHWSHYLRACFLKPKENNLLWRILRGFPHDSHPNTHKHTNTQKQYLKLESSHKAFPDVPKSVFTEHSTEIHS